MGFRCFCCFVDNDKYNRDIHFERAVWNFGSGKMVNCGGHFTAIAGDFYSSLADIKKAACFMQLFFHVPGAGVEPARGFSSLVFETSASTNSAIRAMGCEGNDRQYY